jgi:hypothetical protein
VPEGHDLLFETLEALLNTMKPGRVPGPKTVHVKATLPASVQISTHNPQNLIVVENETENVIFRAAYDNFSERRKAFLVRQLAAEGYIPDCFEEFTEYRPSSGLVWVIDRSLLFVAPEASRRCSRFMRRLVLGGCLLLVLELGVLLLKS